ncbi:putative transcription elongation factor [Leptomonas seymouri]|uniref:Putative transcription elongation factor n=1 Tax=Leptomonas seymouri TaxID=5684 RepID=A0A0N1PFJ1_LEPSE|nr:putative transcription elongation factor [Leptomonas seymouri]|eukprot:KPI88908.1 putative transcription elongation factor [Leptomonas seymouri]
MADATTSPMAACTAAAALAASAAAPIVDASGTTMPIAQDDKASAPTNDTKPAKTTPAKALKRSRAAEPVTQLLNPAVTRAIPFSSVESNPPPSSTLAVGVCETRADEVPVPPKQVRTDDCGDSSLTPRSPYANLPRKIPRKTPVSTPSSSLGTPTLVSPSQASPTLSTPPQSSAMNVNSPAAKLAALHQRWANLIHGALMKERQPHETEAVMALSRRIVEALPGNLEESKDSFQTLLFSIKDEKNGELRRKVVEGELLVERLVQMDDRELANPEVRRRIEERMEDRAKDTNLSELAKAMRTSNSTLFKCKTCGARDTSWYQRQTRSGDEPMTVIITCNRCNTQWRQY